MSKMGGGVRLEMPGVEGNDESQGLGMKQQGQEKRSQACIINVTLSTC